LALQVEQGHFDGALGEAVGMNRLVHLVRDPFQVEGIGAD